jgi:hypothetical protein
MQGRYLLPVLALAAATLCSAPLLPVGWKGAALVLPTVAFITFADIVTTDAVIVSAFALF